MSVCMSVTIKEKPPGDASYCPPGLVCMCSLRSIGSSIDLSIDPSVKVTKMKILKIAFSDLSLDQRASLTYEINVTWGTILMPRTPERVWCLPTWLIVVLDFIVAISLNDAIPSREMTCVDSRHQGWHFLNESGLTICLFTSCCWYAPSKQKVFLTCPVCQHDMSFKTILPFILMPYSCYIAEAAVCRFLRAKKNSIW